METMGSTPIHGSRQRDPRASAARKRLCEDAKVIFPPPDGGLLPRAFRREFHELKRFFAAIDAIRVSDICVHLRLTVFRKEETMNNEIIIAIVIAVAIVAGVITAVKFPKIRHAFLVPEGFAGLLYHKGKFVEVLGAGRHVRWGRHCTLDPQDLHKAAFLVAGQEVLTADNVGLKLSLLVTYQVADPAKAAHET